MALFKKKTKLPENAAVPDMPALNIDEEEDEILRRRQPNKAAIVTGLSVLAIVVMILGSLPSGNEKSTEVNTKVLSARPQMASIPSVITGGGALEPGSTEKVKLPEIIDLEKYYVHNGDKMQAGDIIASVDAVQVKAAIGELQDVINKLDKDLSLESSKTDSTSINSGVNGRVKAIYAEVGVDVAKTVYDHGCLMLLSLDGMMSVTFNQEHDAVLGQPVDVELSDGTVQAGRVFAVSDGKVTVTLPDNIAEYGSPAVVKDADGVLLGSGDLDIHSPLQISGYYGTVSYINVKVNQKVSNSSLLMNLKDPGHTADYTALLKRRGELSEQMDTLYAMSDGFIRATKDGIVSDIPDDSEYATAEELAEIAPVAFTGEFEGIKLDLLVNRSFGGNLVLLGSTNEEDGGTGGGSSEEGDDGGGTGTGGKEPAALPFMLSAKIISQDGQFYLDFGKAKLPEGMDNPFPISSDQIIFNSMGKPTPVLSPAAFIAGPLKGQSVSVTMQQTTSDKGNTFTILNVSFYMSFKMPNFSFSFGGIATQQKIYDTYSTETTDIMSLIPQDELTVTINIDELDILQLEEGMDAVITMDAFPGTTFPGTITRVGAFGENQGGNTKFAVEVTLNTTEQMLVGMNAAVRIVTDISEEMLTIPANAIVEEGGKEWVYTKYDARKDELSGLVEIQTGISDGDLVQIIGGIDENTDFYYRYADSIVYSFL